MGRYYSGDIEGKFWFAVQNSGDASFFGGQENVDYLQYYFNEDDLVDVNAGLMTCKKELGDFKKKLDKFFEKNAGYSDEMLVKELEIREEKVKDLLKWYARLELGEKIKKCIVKNKKCSFDAEL